MMAELRGLVLLVAALLFFVLILALLALGSIMPPRRWSERATPAS